MIFYACTADNCYKKYKSRDKLAQHISKKHQQDELCCICIEAIRDTAVIPCGHKFFCYSCINNYYETKVKYHLEKGCPICDGEILLICKIYD